MKLTDRKNSLAGAQATDLIHIVKTDDTSQNSGGSSYKIEMGDYKSLFSFTGGSITGNTVFNGGITANSVTTNIVSATTVNATNINSTNVVTQNLTATTISATTYLGLPTDIRVTGGTYDNTTGVATYTNNTGGTFSVSGFKTSDLVVTGGTYSSGTATFTNNTGGTFNVTGFKTSDLVVTGGTYTAGTATFTNNTGGTFNVTGFTNNSNVTKFIIVKSTTAWLRDSQFTLNTLLPIGSTIISITPTIECVVANNGYDVGDIVNVDASEPSDSGGLPGHGLGVQYKANVYSSFHVNVEDAIYIPSAYSFEGDLGGTFIIGTESQWILRFVILYI